MAVPNLKSATLVVNPGRTLYHLTTTSWVKVIDDIPTDNAMFIEKINVSNKGGAAANVSIQIRSSDTGGSGYDICSKRATQIKSQFNAGQGRADILTEGDSMWAKLEVAGEVDLVIPYTLASEP